MFLLQGDVRKHCPARNASVAVVQLAHSHEWRRILATVHRLLPTVAGVVCYGSNTWGRGGRDYDVLVVVNGREVTEQRRSALAAKIREQTGLPVDMNLATENALRNLSSFDPYLWHVLSTGHRIGNVPDAPRSLTKDGVALALLHIEMLLEDADELGFDAKERAPWLRFAAKTVAVLEQSLAGKADGPAYSSRVGELIVEEELRKALAYLRCLV